MSNYRPITERWIKSTKKKHFCEWCNTRVDAGSYAYRRVYVFDGDFNCGYMHEECAKAMEQTSNEILQDGWMPGDFNRGEIG